MYKALTLLIFITSFKALSNKKEAYRELASRVDHLENSIIQEFNIDLPREAEGRSAADYTKAANQLEVKYRIQRKLFYKIDEGLYNLKLKLENLKKDPAVTEEQIKKLEAKIEYAGRIILKTRKQEIHELYSELKESLVHTPSLEEIYIQLKEMNFKNCALENLKFRKDVSELSFDIKQKNNFGSYSKSSFTLTNLDRKAGRVTSRPDLDRSNLPYQTFVTQYWSGSNDKGEIQQSFRLQLAPSGSITGAEFIHEDNEPLFTLFGYSFGNQCLSVNIQCSNRDIASEN